MQVIWALIGLILTLLTYYVFKFYDESTQNKRRGIIYLGNGLSKVFYKSVKGITHCDYLLEQYSRIKRVRQKFGVGSEFSAKTFFITDLSVIKDICIKKFDHFVNRRCVVSDSDIFIPKMLMAKQGDDWKEVRSKLNQIFIPSRLSGMFPLMDKSSKKLVNYFESQVDSPYSDVETGISKLTMDVFASLAFGMESEAFQNPEKRSNFEEMAAKLPGSLSLSNIFKLCFLHLFPRLAKCLKLSLYSSEAQRYFEKSIKNVITQRTEEKAVSSGSSSEDFLQLMLNLRDAGLPIEVVDQLIKGQPEKKFTFSSKYDTRSKSDKQIAKCELKDEDIVAHCISFILGGYDYTVSLQLFALYNLAMHEEVQEEVHREIVEVLENADSQHFPLDLDVINRLDLLNGLLFGIKLNYRVFYGMSINRYYLNHQKHYGFTLHLQALTECVQKII